MLVHPIRNETHCFRDAGVTDNFMKYMLPRNNVVALLLGQEHLRKVRRIGNSTIDATGSL